MNLHDFYFGDFFFGLPYAILQKKMLVSHCHCQRVSLRIPGKALMSVDGMWFDRDSWHVLAVLAPGHIQFHVYMLLTFSWFVTICSWICSEHLTYTDQSLQKCHTCHAVGIKMCSKVVWKKLLTLPHDAHEIQTHPSQQFLCNAFFFPHRYCTRHLLSSPSWRGVKNTSGRKKKNTHAADFTRRDKKQTCASPENDVCLRILIDEHCNACRRIKFCRKQCLRWPAHSMTVIDSIW